jgi:hypothetical protein
MEHGAYRSRGDWISWQSIPLCLRYYCPAVLRVRTVDGRQVLCSTEWLLVLRRWDGLGPVTSVTSGPFQRFTVVAAQLGVPHHFCRSGAPPSATGPARPAPGIRPAPSGLGPEPERRCGCYSSPRKGCPEADRSVIARISVPVRVNCHLLQGELVPPQGCSQPGHHLPSCPSPFRSRMVPHDTTQPNLKSCPGSILS